MKVFIIMHEHKYGFSHYAFNSAEKAEAKIDQLKKESAEEFNISDEEDLDDALGSVGEFFSFIEEEIQ